MTRIKIIATGVALIGLGMLYAGAWLIHPGLLWIFLGVTAVIWAQIRLAR